MPLYSPRADVVLVKFISFFFSPTSGTKANDLRITLQPIIWGVRVKGDVLLSPHAERGSDITDLNLAGAVRPEGKNIT